MADIYTDLPPAKDDKKHEHKIQSVENEKPTKRMRLSSNASGDDAALNSEMNMRNNSSTVIGALNKIYRALDKKNKESKWVKALNLLQKLLESQLELSSEIISKLRMTIWRSGNILLFLSNSKRPATYRSVFLSFADFVLGLLDSKNKENPAYKNVSFLSKHEIVNIRFLRLSVKANQCDESFTFARNARAIKEKLEQYVQGLKLNNKTPALDNEEQGGNEKDVAPGIISCLNVSVLKYTSHAWAKEPVDRIFEVVKKSLHLFTCSDDLKVVKELIRAMAEHRADEAAVSNSLADHTSHPLRNRMAMPKALKQAETENSNN